MYRKIAVSAALLVTIPVFAQSSSAEKAAVVRGVVINSATREPISRALVVSNDNRFATLTDDQGRFAFATQGSDEAAQTEADSVPPGAVPRQIRSNKIMYAAAPHMLFARKPGFLPDNTGSAVNWDANSQTSELKLTLVPEALIVGKVTLANAEAPDSIQLQLYRRLVKSGHARWAFAKGTSSRANGEFRFSELPSGTYKLLSAELLDRDPLIFNPRGQLYGYPPAYYPSAAGFDSATEIRVGAGETAQANLSLVRQPYYNVRIPIVNAPSGAGFNIAVYAAGHRGPGYTLGYNPRDQMIQGSLPDGIYTIEATSYGRDNAIAAASVNITVHGGPVTGPAATPVTGSSIQVVVKEEFTSSQASTLESYFYNSAGRRFELKGPRRYLNITLEPTDEFTPGRNSSLHTPANSSDEALVLENVVPGHYWVRVTSARGYVASARSGATDLLQQPLVVSAAGSNPPLEITVRDETGEIEGTIEGISGAEATSFGIADGNIRSEASLAPTPAPAHVYCIPLPDSGGSFSEVWVSPDGNFRSPPLPPGAYRVLAFERPQSELEYENPEAMRAYESKGPVVRLAAGQKERVRLQLISEE